MASIGHPVVGDTLYGAPQILLPNTLARERQGNAISSRTEAKKARAHGESAATLSLARNFLHAAHLNFTHPKSGKAVEFDGAAARGPADISGEIAAAVRAGWVKSGCWSGTRRMPLRSRTLR